MADRELPTAEKKKKEKESPPPDYFSVIRVGKTAVMVDVDDVTLRRLEEKGLFPPRFKINPAGGQRGAAGHFYGEVVDYLKARAAESRSAAVVAVLAVVSVATLLFANFLA